MRTTRLNHYLPGTIAGPSSTKEVVATTLKRLALGSFVLVLCANCGVFGSTSSFFTGNEVSPANAFSAGVWDPADPPAPQVDLSAPQSFSLVVSTGDLADPPSDPPLGDPGDDASSTQPGDPPADLGTDASSTPPVVQISDGTTTISDPSSDPAPDPTIDVTPPPDPSADPTPPTDTTDTSSGPASPDTSSDGQ